MSAQVLAAQGVSEDELDAELAECLAEADRQAVSDEGVSSVLLLSAQAELRALRSAPASASTAPAEAEVRTAQLTHAADAGRMNHVYRKCLTPHDHKGCNSLAAWCTARKITGSWTDTCPVYYW